jgi:hypothetical protein
MVTSAAWHSGVDLPLMRRTVIAAIAPSGSTVISHEGASRRLELS